MADHVMAQIKQGKDVRGLTAVLDRVYADTAKPVQKRSTIEALAQLSSADRRTLLAQLEAARDAEPTGQPLASRPIPRMVER